MRVLNVLPGVSARLGGPAAFVGGSAVELSKLGVEVRVAATDLALAPTGWLQRQKRARRDELHPSFADCPVEVFPARFPRRLAFSWALRRALRTETAEVSLLHIHNLWQFPQYAAYTASIRQRIPYVVSFHGGMDPFIRRRGRVRKRLTMELWQRRMFERAALIHVTTEAEKALTADVAPDVPRAVVPCGLYTREFENLPPGDRFRDERLDGYDGQVVMFLGRVTEKKGLDVLIRAFARARQVRPCRLAIVGPDDSRLGPGLRRISRELGVECDVVFVGPVYGEERRAALSCADVWALSSHAENFGIAVVEAMAAGRPAVISPAVNLAGEVAAEQAGLVADAEPRAFGDALLEILVDDDRRLRVAERGRAFAARYDWSVVAPRLVDMYRIAAGPLRTRPEVAIGT